MRPPPTAVLSVVLWLCAEGQLPPEHSTAWPYEDDDTSEPLEKVFTASFRAGPSQAGGLWRYGRPPAEHEDLIAREGEILVEAVDNPKEPVGPWRNDVLTIVAAPTRPASLTLRVPLEPKHHGVNRLQMFVYLSSETCSVDNDLINRTLAEIARGNSTWNHTCASERCCPRQPAYDTSGQVLSAWLGRHGDASVVLREVSLSAIDFIGEWEEVDADFYVTPDEDGAGDDGLVLYVKFGDAAATEGTAHLTGLQLTPVPLVNVAWLKPVGNAPPPPQDGVAAGDVLTNGIFSSNLGETWYQIVAMDEEVTFTVELFGTYMACSTVVQFAPGTQTYEWEFYMSHSNQGGVWTSVLLDDQRADLEAHGALGWVPSSAPRHFPCQLTKRAKLTLRRTQNFIFSMTEWAIYGYDMATEGPCGSKCRHGGTCRYFGEPCRCVSKWGWRGPVCDDDIDECELNPQTTLAQELSIEHANAGCGLGDASASKCKNTDGGWTCTCHHGFSGATTSMARNECVDVNECVQEGPALVPNGPTLERGGCEQICINLVGSYGQGLKTTHRCDCQQGFELQADNRTCGPKCSQPCEHGSSCVEPEKCRECDDGWQGDYCQDPLCSHELEVLDDLSGEWMVKFGCYHGGRCVDGGECVECRSGWSGSDCGYYGAGTAVSLVVAVLGGLVILLPTLIVVLWRRKWIPVQERGAGLMLNSTLGCGLWIIGSSACGNPKLFGIRLVTDAVQPEDSLWGLWIPFTIGFSWHIACCTIRMRNLVLIHLKGNTPFTLVCQLPLSAGVFAGVSILPSSIRYGAWASCLGLLLVYFLINSIYCLPLRADIGDIIPNMVCGLLSIGSMLGLFVCRAAGASYTNPEGLIGNLFPIIFAVLGVAHVASTHGRLAWSLRKVPKKSMIAQYSKGDESHSDEEDEDGKPKFGAKWKKVLLSKSQAIIAVGDAAAGGPQANGDTSKAGKSGDDDSDDSDSTSTSASESEPESSNGDSSAEQAKSPKSQIGPPSSEETRDATSLSDSSASAGGRGGGFGRGSASRGRGRGRGWNRSSRGRATGRARGRIRLPALSLKASPAKAVAEAQPRTTAQLWKAVQRKAAEEADSDASSEDSELEELAAEVRKFEKMVEKRKTRGKEGNVVPQFHGKTWGEQGVSGGGSSLDGFGLDMQMRKQIMQKQADVWGSSDAPSTRPFSAPPEHLQQPHQNTARPATAGVSRSGNLPGQPGSPPHLQQQQRQQQQQQQVSWSGPSKDTDGPQVVSRSNSAAAAESELLAWLDSHRVAEWLHGLQSLGVGAIVDLVDVDDEDLQELGMKPVPRRRLLRAIGQISLDRGTSLQSVSENRDAKDATSRPQSAPARKHTETDGVLGRLSKSGLAQRPASAAPARSEWGSAGSELKQLQEQARKLEADADTSAEDESDEEGGSQPEKHLDAAWGQYYRPRMETDAYPGEIRAARKGAKARAALAAAKAFEAEITTDEYDTEYESEDAV